MRPYWQSDEHGLAIYHGDCLEVMPALEQEFDLCLTDPPYGCGKRGAIWDIAFPTEWYAMAKMLAETVGVVTGSCGVRESIALDPTGFLDVIAGWNANSLTRGPLGFGNWLACTVFGKRPRQGQNFTRFTISGTMPEHPTPKPIQFIEWLVARLAERGDAIIDPFLGSGTTLVACYRLGRHAVGCDISEEYCELSAKRLEAELAQLRIPETVATAQPAQLVMEDADA